MTTKKERGLSAPTSQAFLSMAQQYHFAATTLFSAASRAEFPLYFLYTHTIELALKAFLRSRGLSTPRTHALRSLCNQCQEMGLRMHDDLVTVIHLLESENKVHGFRYFVFASTSKPEIGYLRQAVDNLMTDVTEESSKRSKEEASSGVVFKFTVGKAVKK
jgi:HEPN domain-containing protein